MGVEVVESKLADVLETGNKADMSAEVGQVGIKFGSQGTDEPAKKEVKKVSANNFPKDAADEWPEPMQIHSFYFVRYRTFEDPNLKAKLDVAEKELQKKNQARLQIIEKVRAKKSARAQIRTQIHTLSVENKQFKTVLDEKKKEMEPLQQALGKLRGSRERGSGICSSEEELNNLIKSLQYRIQHESVPLSEEKQILREIKQLEGTRELVIAKAAERAKIQDSMGEKGVLQDQVKLIGVDLDGVRKEKQAVFAKIKQLDEGKLALEKEISALESELKAVTQNWDTLCDKVKEMRKQREDGNAPFYQNRTLLNKAKVVAASKDVKAVKELANLEVDKFMSLWSTDKSFRDDYERRILQSLDMRQLSRDGRIRNPNEKPLLQVEKTTPPEPEVVVKTKQPPKEENTASKAKSAKTLKEGNKKTEIAKIDQEEDKEEVFLTDKPLKEPLSKSAEKVDEKKLKELKRQDEVAKRKLAEERKRKLAEKAATKAAIKAQKEAVKKLKEREKRARKKSGGVAFAAEEPTEPVAEVAEPEEVEEKVETPVPQKSKNENTIRHRARPRGPASVPKAILNRRKATNYWLWALPAAGAVVLVFAALVYSYLS